MKNELTTFLFEEGREVRTLERDGETWFVAKDVCDILEHSNPTVALQMLDDDEKFIINATDEEPGDPKLFLGSEKGGGARSINLVNESGIYNLIFRSNKPEAKVFRKWVTSVVLPAIRKKGIYGVPALMEQVEKTIERANNLIDDPKRAAYEELEAWLGKTVEYEEKKIHRVFIRELYRAYCKAVKNPLNEHNFKYKIAQDHPEYELKQSKQTGWYFTYCFTRI